MYQLCQPCTPGVVYDHVGKIETASTDLPHILSHVNKDGATRATRVLNSAGNNTDNKSYLKYYKNIPRRIIEKVKRRYRLDFEIFGYDIDEVNGI